MASLTVPRPCPASGHVVLFGAYGQTALSLAGSAWAAVTSPFAIFGTDRWGLNLLFYFAVLLMGYNLIVQAPKQ